MSGGSDGFGGFGKDAEEEPNDRELATLPHSDLGNARRLIARHGRDMMWVEGVGWHVWDDRVWNVESGEAEALKRAHLTADSIKDEVQAMIAGGRPETMGLKDWEKIVDKHKTWATQSGNQAKCMAMLEAAKPYLLRQVRELDDKPLLVNCQNCTIDFANGRATARPHDRNDLLTRIVPFDYDGAAQCPTFDAFLERILPDEAVRGFVQRYLGYSLCGLTTEQAFNIWYGKGANGKSTLIEAVDHVAGNYACISPIETFMYDDRKSAGQATPDIARLASVRLVSASELELGKRLSEAVVKQITGGERMAARHLNKGYFEFYPQFKLVLSVNIKPVIKGQDEGIWRRVFLVPFEVTIPKHQRDRMLAKKLRDEGGGILRWLLDGLEQWLEGGLQPPAAVLAATEEYRTESDPIGEFINSCTRHLAGGSVTAKTLYGAYVNWCKANGHKITTMHFFGRRLSDLGLKKDKVGVVHYLDIELTQTDFGQGDSADAAAGGSGHPYHPDNLDDPDHGDGNGV